MFSQKELQQLEKKSCFFNNKKSYKTVTKSQKK